MQRIICMLTALLIGAGPVYAQSGDSSAAGNASAQMVKEDGSSYKVFVQNVKVVGLDEAYTTLYADKIANALSELNLFDVVTMKDIGDLIDYEKQKELLACDAVSCAAEIGGAMGADFILTSTVIKQESSFSLSTTFTDVNNMRRLSGEDESIMSSNTYYIDKLIKLETKALLKQYLSAEDQKTLVAQIAAVKKEASSGGKASANLVPAAVTTGALGGAALITGAVMAGLAQSKKNLLVNGLPEAEATTIFTKDRQYSVTSFVMFGVGGALAVTSVALAAVNAKNKKGGAAKNNGKQLTLVPAVNGQGVFLAISGNYR